MNLPTIVATFPPKPYLFFISYAHASSSVTAEWLVQKLENDGVPKNRIFYDATNMTQLSDMERNLSKTYCVIIVLTNEYFSSENCQREADFAVKKKMKMVAIRNNDEDYDIKSPGSPGETVTQRAIRNLLFVHTDQSNFCFELYKRAAPEDMKRDFGHTEALSTRNAFSCPRCHAVITPITKKQWDAVSSGLWWAVCCLTWAAPICPCMYDQYRPINKVCPKCDYVFERLN